MTLDLDDPALIDPLPHRLPENRGRYNLADAVRHMANPENRGKPVGGLVGEVDAEIARRSGRKPRGLFIPLDLDVRALDTTAGAGGIPNRLGTLQDVLRAKMVIARFGATFLPDCTGGAFSLPKKASASAVSWVGEGSDAESTEPLIGAQAQFKPRNVGAFCDYSRKAIASIPNLDAVLADDLSTSIAHELDRIALAGAGTSLEPLGLTTNPSTAVVALGDPDGGAPTRAKLAEMLETLGNANAEGDSLGWITSPAGRRVLQTTEKATGSGRYLWDDDNRLLGIRADATTSIRKDVTKGAGTALTLLLLGNWSELAVATWGAIDIQINPYRFATTGYYRIRALLDADVNVRHGSAFVIANDMATI